uniref:Leucine aminopeptidase n=1 Tax=Mycena chlorophos TaxID=658473 RepID=A0ABQ0LM36_MYCCL|nr:leucine aminopeptidase [Mycena chlorophos]
MTPLPSSSHLHLAEVFVDGEADPHAAGAYRGAPRAYRFTLKTSGPKRVQSSAIKALESSAEWDRGVVYGEAQSLARTLMELPSNMLTPTLFAERIQQEFAGLADTTVWVRDEDWARKKGMRTFLSVCSGSTEPGKFVEMHYQGAPSSDAAPLVLVGKGITFDTGGISLKPAADMKLMRGDMGGAAAVVAAIQAIAKLKLPINVVALTPLTENMPSGSATKPGDVIYAMNGKTVEVDNTDAEGRLVLADAIYYGSTEFNAHTLIDVATLTGAMDIALGEVFTGVFTPSDTLWEQLYIAGEHEYDRFWRMPLDDDCAPQISGSNADLCNLYRRSIPQGVRARTGRRGAPDRLGAYRYCGDGGATREKPYLLKGMTGSSVRALIDMFAVQTALNLSLYHRFFWFDRTTAANEGAIFSPRQITCLSISAAGDLADTFHPGASSRYRHREYLGLEGISSESSLAAGVVPESLGDEMGRVPRVRCGPKRDACYTCLAMLQSTSVVGIRRRRLAADLEVNVP